MIWRGGWILILAVGLSICGRAGEERIWVEAKVNGNPARIFLDTGAGEFFLFRNSASRVGLKLARREAPENSWKMYWASERVRLECTGFSGRIRPAIAEPPAYINVGEVDGFIGWKTIHENVVKFDALHTNISVLPDVPVDVKETWIRFKVREKRPRGWNRWGILALETGEGSGQNSPRRGSATSAAGEIIIIDTGSTSGAGIPSARWDAWKAAHTNQPVTIEAVAMPSVGIFSREQSKAKEYSIGPLTLTDLIIEEAEPWSESLAREQHAATFGLAALKRLDLIVDGKNGVAYLRAKSTPATPYSHNRFGAVFLPQEGHGDDLVADVVEGTPAYEAGVRDGDVLLKLDGVDVTSWRKNMGSVSGFQRRAFWERPAGTRVRLTLRRAGREFEVEGTLRDLIE